IMENSRIYDSFQHELEDYVRKQKARGLQPEVCFRKVTEDYVYRERGHTAPAPRPLLGERRLPFRRSHTSSSHKRQRTVDNPLPPWSNLHHSRQRLESLNQCQEKHDHFFKTLWRPSPPVQRESPDPRAAQRREDTSCLWEEGHTRAHQAGDQDQCQRRRSREEEGRGGCSKEKQVEGKTTHGQDAESHKENRKKAKVQPVQAERPKHRKKKCTQDTTKEGKRSQREKRLPGKESIQERDLWDEAILGS
ncbi:KRCC1 protein, partial [Crocuta crocuta]